MFHWEQWSLEDLLSHIKLQVQAKLKSLPQERQKRYITRDDISNSDDSKKS